MRIATDLDPRDLYVEGGSLPGGGVAAMVAVGGIQSLALSAIRGADSVEEFASSAVQSAANIAGSILGGVPGAIIGAVGSVAGALFGGRDNDAVPVRIRDVDDRAADKLKADQQPDVQLYLNGRRATGEEEQRLLGYRLDRISRLQGESTTGV